jgi:hypothetical protein
MGGSLSRMWSLLWSKKEIRILILGLVCGVIFPKQDNEGEMEADRLYYHLG